MMNQEDRVSFNKEYWRFLWSSILIALSGCLGNVVDGIIVGNLIGEDAVSAINISRTVIQFMFTLSMLLSTGAGMLVGMQLGKKDMARAAYIYTVSMASCLAVGLLLTITGLTIPGTVAGWLCKNELLLQPTLDYLQPMLLGAPAYMMVWAMGTMVGVDGSPRLVSLAIMVDNAVNLCLDVVFIQWFDWGIAGSSAATVVGHLVGIAIMCRHYFFNNNHLRMTWQHDHPALSGIISQGAPLAVASICLTLLLYSANTIVLSSVGRVGIFAFAVCMNLLQIYNLFLAGVCRTIQSLGAIQVGKGDNETFRMVLHKSFWFITMAMVLTCVFVWIVPEAITKFFGASDESTIAEGSRALRIFALSFIPFCYIYALMIVYKLYGHHRMALFISFALSLTVIPVMWAVSRWAPELLWYSYLIAYLVEALMIFAFHHFSRLRFTLKMAVAATTALSGGMSLSACSDGKSIPAAPDYQDSTQWYVTNRQAAADVFYIISTETGDYRLPNGEMCHWADTYSDSLRAPLYAEMLGVDTLISGRLNFFSPYYRQCSLQSFQSDSLTAERMPLATDDVRRAFKHYLKHQNGGRPFILAGFSQGAHIMLELLKEMDDHTYQQLIAAYAIGIAIHETAPHIVPAKRADDTGVTICYNSVRDTSCTMRGWEQSIMAINPVNWKTDSTRATLITEPSPLLPVAEQKQDTMTVHLDTTKGLLIVEGFTAQDYVLPLLGVEGNYHSREIWLYRDQLRENMALRAARYQH